MNEVLDGGGAREALARFALDGDTAFLEAASAVRTAARSLDKLRTSGSGDRGLSPGAMDVLILLSAAETGMSVKDLAGATNASSRNVTGLVDTLEGAGLAERTASPVDRRVVLVRVTEAGLAWLEAFRRPTQLAMAALFRGFTGDEVEALRLLCLRLAENQRALAERIGGRG